MRKEIEIQQILKSLRVVKAATKQNFTEEEWLEFKRDNDTRQLHLTSLTEKNLFKEEKKSSFSSSIFRGFTTGKRGLPSNKRSNTTKLRGAAGLVSIVQLKKAPKSSEQSEEQAEEAKNIPLKQAAPSSRNDANGQVNIQNSLSMLIRQQDVDSEDLEGKQDEREVEVNREEADTKILELQREIDQMQLSYAESDNFSETNAHTP